MRARYDFIVCGAGSSGCVVARRLAEGGGARVLLLEAGGGDDVAEVIDPTRWTENIGSERDWGFTAEPNAALGGRRLPLAMGKVLGGGSSINGLMWIRGHRQDWDHYAAESGDAGWGFDEVTAIYERIEARQDAPHRAVGDGAVVRLQPANPTGVTPLLVEAAASAGLPTFDSPNGRMMELDAAAATMEVIVHGGRRRSMYRAYVAPILGAAQLDVWTGAVVTRVVVENGRAIGVEVRRRGDVVTVLAGKEVVLSMGAIHTPKLLFQSGVGDREELERLGVPVRRHLPGVGRNFQDHVMMFGVVSELRDRDGDANASRAVLQSTSDQGGDRPDLQILQSAGGAIKAEMSARGLDPQAWWSLAPGLVSPRSRGRLRFEGAGHEDGVRIEAAHLSHPADRAAALRSIALCREMAGTPALRPRIGRELLPATSDASDLQRFVRERTVTYWHQSCTAKMGRDDMSVVDASLRVYGIEGLRVADASVLPRITTGNTMAPSVIIGERAGEMLRREHGV